MKKRNKIILVISAVFVVIAIALLIIGFAISGADIIGWFSSQWAMWFYVIIGTYLLILAMIFIGEKIKKL